MAQVILINPKVGLSDEFKGIKILPVQPPLSLLNASIFLEGKYSIAIIDQRIDPGYLNALEKELENGTIAVGITSCTGMQIGYALDICKEIRKRSSCPIVWGGVHASLLPEQTLKSKYVDIIVENEGELTFPELVAALQAKKDLRSVKGLYFKEGEKIIHTGKRLLVDINSLPPLPFHLLDMEKYLAGKNSVALETSRGCPFSCAYCYNKTLYGDSYREMGIDSIKAQVDALIGKYGVSHIDFIDDNFLVNKDRASLIMSYFRELRKAKEVTWSIFGIRADDALKAGRPFLEDLYASGCKDIHFGIESGSQRILDLINKGMAVDKIIGLNRMAKDIGIVFRYNLMVGFPTETKEDMKKTCSLVYDLLSDNPDCCLNIVAIFQPWPKNALTELCKRQFDYKEPERLEDWASYNWQKFNGNWATKDIASLCQKIYLASLGLRIRKGNSIRSYMVRNMILSYRKIALYRFENFNFNVFAEAWIIRTVLRRRLY